MLRLLFDFFFQLNLFLQLRIRVNYKGDEDIEYHKVSRHQKRDEEEHYVVEMFVTSACAVEKYDELPVVEGHNPEQRHHA